MSVPPPQLRPKVNPKIRGGSSSPRLSGDFTSPTSKEEDSFEQNISPIPSRPDSPGVDRLPSVTIIPETVQLEEAEAQRREDVIGGHIVYKFRVEAERRFREFVRLRIEFVERWPGIYIPPLPPKKAFVFFTQGNLDKSFVEIRRKQLYTFMSNVSRLGYLYRSEEYQQFLRGGYNYDKCVAGISCATSKRILAKYKRYLVQPELGDNDHEDAVLEEYEKEFKWQVEALRGLKHRTKALYDGYAQFQSNLLSFSEEVMKIEPAFRNQEAVEPWFEYPNRPHGFENPYALLYSWFVMEKQECVAIFDAIKSRNDIFSRHKAAIADRDKNDRKLKKVMSGAFVFTFMKKNKLKMKLDTRVQAVSSTQLDKEIKYLQEIGQISSRQLVKVDLPQFMERRTERYAELLRDFGSLASMEFEEVSSTQMLKNGLIIGSRQMGPLEIDT